eukprot:m.186621 g.186621  ORF g.186621 m.186621 type:complete len:64 (+) comp39354_c0_seq14:1776-1967(+)
MFRSERKTRRNGTSLWKQLGLRSHRRPYSCSHTSKSTAMAVMNVTRRIQNSKQGTRAKEDPGS